MSVTADRRVILSLGAGVQSTALALMALRGDLPASYARPMAAVFADTGFEPRRVYQHLYWMTETLGTELPVHIVRAMRPDGTPAHIREDTEAIVRDYRLANPPVVVITRDQGLERGQDERSRQRCFRGPSISHPVRAEWPRLFHPGLAAPFSTG